VSDKLFSQKCLSLGEVLLAIAFCTNCFLHLTNS